MYPQCVTTSSTNSQRRITASIDSVLFLVPDASRRNRFVLAAVMPSDPAFMGTMRCCAGLLKNVCGMRRNHRWELPACPAWIDVTRIFYTSRQRLTPQSWGWSPPARKIDNPPLVASCGETNKLTRRAGTELMSRFLSTFKISFPPWQYIRTIYNLFMFIYNFISSPYVKRARQKRICIRYSIRRNYSKVIFNSRHGFEYNRDRVKKFFLLHILFLFHIYLFLISIIYLLFT